MSKGYKKNNNPFGDEDSGLPETLDIHKVDEMGYGATELPSIGRVVARPIEINSIRPDFKQPRQAIPSIVVGAWDGDPDELEDVLVMFHDYAESEYGEIDVKAILQGKLGDKWAIPQDSEDSPIFLKYAKLINLASNILNEGLTNPITVVRRGDGYQIETGERRWLAFHLLAKYIDPVKYGKIPAREVEYDVFRQASENNSRDDLNAIGMAKQVALLIMALLDDEHHYDSLENTVLHGESKRRFYAQVANGYVHSVPEALRPKIQKAVRGLAWNTISNYRALLAITGNNLVDDAIWEAGENFDWSLRNMLELKVPTKWDDEFSKAYVTRLDYIVQHEDWEYDDLKFERIKADESFDASKLQKEREAARESQESLNQDLYVGQTVYVRGDEHIIENIHRNGAINTVHVKTGVGHTFTRGDISTEASTEQGGEDESLMGRWVRLKSGTVGQVVFQSGTVMKFKHASGERTISLADVDAVDVDPVNGDSPIERKRAQDFFGKTVLVLRDGHKIPGVVTGVIGSDEVKVLQKNGTPIKCHISEIEIDVQKVTPDKQSSQTLSDYYDKTPSSPSSHSGGGTPISERLASEIRKKMDEDDSEWAVGDYATLHMPVALLAQPPQIIVAAPAAPFDDLQGLIARAASQPGALNFGSAGNGTSHHLAGELFKLRAGVDLAHVPYTGAGPMLLALMGSQVDLAFDGLGSSAQHLRSGKIKPIAVAAPRRSPAFPEVPTTAQAGLPGYEVSTWYAMWAPRGTPLAIVERMHAEVQKALDAPRIRKAWLANGSEVPRATRAEFGRYLHDEVRRWAEVARSAGIKAD